MKINTHKFLNDLTEFGNKHGLAIYEMQFVALSDGVTPASERQLGMISVRKSGEGSYLLTEMQPSRRKLLLLDEEQEA